MYIELTNTVKDGMYILIKTLLINSYNKQRTLSLLAHLCQYMYSQKFHIQHAHAIIYKQCELVYYIILFMVRNMHINKHFTNLVSFF